jgi:KipI family sensor histidine kinase inhibitor
LARTDDLPENPPRLVTIPVRYGGPDGPDLDDVARLTGLPPDEVIARHAGLTYEVRFLGFTPGFAYLGPLDPRLVCPRLDRPRRSVPAGSVAIAADQTAVYPASTPGGWRLLGRTERVLFDPSRDPMSLLTIGDRVRFEPLT